MQICYHVNAESSDLCAGPLEMPLLFTSTFLCPLNQTCHFLLNILWLSVKQSFVPSPGKTARCSLRLVRAISAHTSFYLTLSSLMSVGVKYSDFLRMS